MDEKLKFCKFCGQKVPEESVMCIHCGRQIEELKTSQQQVVINNINNSNMHSNTKNKWVSILLCTFLGLFGAHKFYEGKILLGIIYLVTVGFLGVGVIIDFFSLLFKPNPYHV